MPKGKKKEQVEEVKEEVQVIVTEEVKDTVTEEVLRPSVDTTGDETELNYENFVIKEDN